MRIGLSIWNYLVVAVLLAVPLGSGTAREGALLSEFAPGVVGVSVFSPEDRYPPRSGSGFVVDKGLVVTSLRLLGDIARDNGVVELHSFDGEVHYARAIIGMDQEWDLALLETKGFKDDALPLAADEAAAEVGQRVVAVTGPRRGQITSSVDGLVIRLLAHAGHEDLMQVSNQISRAGNGGPVLSEQGEVVGLARSTSRDGLAVSLAVPVRAIRELVEKSRAEPDERKLDRFSKETQKKRSAALEARDQIERRCQADDIGLIDRVIGEAISSGAPIYDNGDHLGCYRLYEGASYKLLYTLESRCEPATELLEQFIADAHGAEETGGSPSVQAWTMRYGFDALLGRPK